MLNLRKDFPILENNYIYLDSAATSLTPNCVIEAMLEYYNNFRANIGRSIYKIANKALEAYEEARNNIAKLINAKSNEIIFVRNTTEAINIIANGLEFNKENNIVTTILEHHSNYLPWIKRNIPVRIIMCNNEGEISDFSLIDKNTKIVAITHVSNVLGVKTPIKEIIKIAHENNAFVLVDGAQSVPHMKIDVKELDCDFMAFSGHKMCGPTGIGVLYIKEELQEIIPPLILGGGIIEDVDINSFILRKGPEKYEAGTPAIAEAIGLGEAALYLMKIGMNNIEEYEKYLTRKLLEKLSEIDDVIIYGPKDPSKRTGIVSFNIRGMDPNDVAEKLDKIANIMVRSGFHCAIPLHKYILKAYEGTVRVSLYLYNNIDEIEIFIETIRKIINGKLNKNKSQ
ncbi:MAG: cysteine desulfurase [Candidatus Methanomethylicia archaeon]|nr:cysteine desulfurase [Candidatus Methanomethylicia archaeon]